MYPPPAKCRYPSIQSSWIIRADIKGKTLSMLDKQIIPNNYFSSRGSTDMWFDVMDSYKGLGWYQKLFRGTLKKLRTSQFITVPSLPVMLINRLRVDSLAVYKDNTIISQLLFMLLSDGNKIINSRGIFYFISLQVISCLSCH